MYLNVPTLGSLKVMTCKLRIDCYCTDFVSFKSPEKATGLVVSWLSSRTPDFLFGDSIFSLVPVFQTSRGHVCLSDDQEEQGG